VSDELLSTNISENAQQSSDTYKSYTASVVHTRANVISITKSSFQETTATVSEKKSHQTVRQ